MENQEIEFILQPLVGKTVNLDGTQQKFEGFAINGNKVAMSFTNTIMPVKIEDLELFIGKLDIVGSGLQQVKPAQESTVLSVIERTAGPLADIILDNINRVKNDPAFIPQAESIVNQLKALVDLGKAEIEMKKTTFMINKANF